MVPPHLVEKWAREVFLTVPGVRVFFIDDLRIGHDGTLLGGYALTHCSPRKREE
jgi:hypothetical protein